MDQEAQFRSRIEEATTRRDRLRAQLAEIETRRAEADTPGLAERARNLQAGIDGNEHDRQEAVARLAGYERLVAAAANPHAHEAGAAFDAPPIPSRTPSGHFNTPGGRAMSATEQAAIAARDDAHRAIETHAATLTPEAGAVLHPRRGAPRRVVALVPPVLGGLAAGTAGGVHATGRAAVTTPRQRIPPPRIALRPDEAAAALGLGRTTFEEQVMPHLRVIYIGRTRLIPLAELERWADHNATR